MRRPSPWASQRLSRIIVGGRFDCQIWIIASGRCSIASVRQPHAGSTGTPSSSSLLDTVRNLAWPLIASWLFATACIWNHAVWQQIRSTNNSRLCADSLTKLPTQACSALNLAAGISRVKGVKQLGFHAGNWLSAVQSSEVLQRALCEGLRAKRDYAMLALLFGCSSAWKWMRSRSVKGIGRLWI
jgi:hypothetical protein